MKKTPKEGDSSASQRITDLIAESEAGLIEWVKRKDESG